MNTGQKFSCATALQGDNTVSDQCSASGTGKYGVLHASAEKLQLELERPVFSGHVHRQGLYV